MEDFKDELEMKELLRMQEEFLSGHEKPAASCIRPKSKPKFAGEKKVVSFTDSKPTPAEEKELHMTEDDQAAEAEPAEPMVGSICERFVGFFEMPDRVTVPIFPSPCERSDLDADDLADGDLPEAMDLSEYWTNEDACAVSGKSIFGTYFDRIQEKKRHRKKLSKFKASRQAPDESVLNDNSTTTNAQSSSGNDSTNNSNNEEKKTWEEEVIKNLEIFNDYGLGDATDKYSRLAMDAVNISFASKVMKNTVPRQEAAVLRLFDMLKNPPAKRPSTTADMPEIAALCDETRMHLEEIRSLYLEEFEIESGYTIWRFAPDVNPVMNGEWSLIPIRRVLDAVQQRGGGATSDDVEICRLALMWSVLLLMERPFVFHELSMPNDVYVRLAELYLIDPNIFENDTISKCVSIFISDYLFVKGRKNLLDLRLTAPIASLDAFLPFYEDLLKHFEEYSTGDVNFSLLILIAAYMNANVTDRLVLAQAVWAPGRYVVRQITISSQHATPIFDQIKEHRNAQLAEIEEQHYEAYTRLLAMYAAAIRDESVTRTRNPMVFEIAASELGEFVRRHSSGEKSKSVAHLPTERVKEMDILVDVLRSTTAGKLSL